MGRIGDNARFPTSGVWNIADVYRHLRFDPAPAVVRSASLWLDAADLSTITESGGDVSQWNNKGTLGNFTQATGASQPTTGVGTLNGLNVINFAGDFMTSADSAATWKFLHDGTTHLVAGVFKPGNTANPNGRLAFTGTAISSLNIGHFLGYDDRSTSSRNDAMVHIVNNGSGSGFTSVLNLSSNDFLLANTFSVLTLISDPDNATAADRSEFARNSGTLVKNNSNTSAVSSSNPTNTLQIGADGAGGEALTGSIAEIVIVSGADATEGNRVIIRDYLNAKWDVF